jgi:hypothetical protein
MSTTTTNIFTRTDDILRDAHKANVNYARALGHMQGTARGAIYLLESLLLYGDLNPLDAEIVQRVISNLNKAEHETQDAQAFGNSKD